MSNSARAHSPGKGRQTFTQCTCLGHLSLKIQIEKLINSLICAIALFLSHVDSRVKAFFSSIEGGKGHMSVKPPEGFLSQLRTALPRAVTERNHPGTRVTARLPHTYTALQGAALDF